jgi:hypothetical protein
MDTPHPSRGSMPSSDSLCYRPPPITVTIAPSHTFIGTAVLTPVGLALHCTIPHPNTEIPVWSLPGLGIRVASRY